MTGFLDDLPNLNSGEDERARPSRRILPPGMVPYLRPRCPRCGSPDCPTYDSHQVPIRYHRCNACGATFKSVELNYQKGDQDSDK